MFLEGHVTRCQQIERAFNYAGPALQPNPTCSNLSQAKPISNSNISFGNPDAWSYTADPNNELFSAAAGQPTCDMCTK